MCDKYCDCDTCEDEKECYYDRLVEVDPNSNDIEHNCIHPELVCDKYCDCDICEDEKECFYDVPPKEGM